MIEGTRNERVVILVTAYVIGFITAYIGFGVSQLQSPVDVAQLSTQNAASAILSQRSNDSGATFLAVDKDGLILIKGNKRTLLSATGDVTSDSFFSEGQHVAISEYSLSPDNKNVYFCELPSIDSDSCRPYVYSIDENIVYPVRVDGERVAFKADNQSVSWASNGELIVD